MPNVSRKVEHVTVAEHAGSVTVFYDGSCPLCTAEIGVYRRCAGAELVSFTDVSAHEPGTIVAGLDRTIALKRFHVLGVDGRLYSGAEGFARLWLALPTWRWLGRIVLLPGVLQATESVYRGFLVVRPALQWIFRAKAASGSRS
jgi:predicted DCC family thiol-disulfide oxidoreductase YuxK